MLTALYSETRNLSRTRWRCIPANAQQLWQCQRNQRGSTASLRRAIAEVFDELN
jgi:hypothetical protein